MPVKVVVDPVRDQRKRAAERDVRDRWARMTGGRKRWKHVPVDWSKIGHEETGYEKLQRYRRQNPGVRKPPRYAKPEPVLMLTAVQATQLNPTERMRMARENRILPPPGSASLDELQMRAEVAGGREKLSPQDRNC